MGIDAVALRKSAADPEQHPVSRRTCELDPRSVADHLIKLKLRTGVGHIEVRRGTLFDQVPPITAPAVFPDTPLIRSFGDGTLLFSDGSIDFGDGRRIEADGSYGVTIVEQRPDGSIQLDNGAIVRADGTVVTPGGFVIPLPGRPPAAPGTVIATPTPTTASTASTAITPGTQP